MTPLAVAGPAFVEMAHRIVWCIAATVDADSAPRTRVLHPIWEFDGEQLTGWVATSPLSPKAGDLAAHPSMSVTYWAPNHDTCTADCSATWESTPEERAAGWHRLATGPEPVGYDPAIIPGWDDPDSPGFGILRLDPTRLRIMPGSLMLAGTGELHTWHA
jgi:hypothetical protein